MSPNRARRDYTRARARQTAQYRRTRRPTAGVVLSATFVRSEEEKWLPLRCQPPALGVPESHVARLLTIVHSFDLFGRADGTAGLGKSLDVGRRGERRLVQRLTVLLPRHVERAFAIAGNRARPPGGPHRTGRRIVLAVELAVADALLIDVREGQTVSAFAGHLQNPRRTDLHVRRLPLARQTRTAGHPLQHHGVIGGLTGDFHVLGIDSQSL